MAIPKSDGSDVHARHPKALNATCSDTDVWTFLHIFELYIRSKQNTGGSQLRVHVYTVMCDAYVGQPHCTARKASNVGRPSGYAGRPQQLTAPSFQRLTGSAPRFLI
jgi:hypothetical protein